MYPLYDDELDRFYYYEEGIRYYEPPDEDFEDEWVHGDLPYQGKEE